MMIKRYFTNRRNRQRSAQEVFSEVYANKLWGDHGLRFFSGPGSFDEFAEPYVAMIADYVANNHPHKVSIVDLGCGDFNVGEKLVSTINPHSYHGVDVVPDLIEHHQQNHASTNVQFSRLDIAEDELPDGEIACIRQVLQHLSNAQILRICKKFEQYGAVFITEHFPALVRMPNVDKVHGRNSRRRFKSAVCLDQPPFCLPNLEKVLVQPYPKRGESLVTYLYRPDL